MDHSSNAEGFANAVAGERIIGRPAKKKRELIALSEAMAELNINSGMIVTRSESEQIKTDSGTIEVVPIWRFLLS